MPPYKTIVHELLQDQYPSLHERLRKERGLLPALDQFGTTLRAYHNRWIDLLSMKKPESDPAMIASEALELAIQGLREDLPSESPPNGAETEPFSLDEAIAFVRLHTPSA